MKISDLHQLIKSLDCLISAKVEMAKTLQNNQSLEKKKGVSINIHLDDDFPQVLFTKFDIANLCKAYILDLLNQKELSLLSDMFLLSNSIEFQEEKIREILENMTDPEINGSFTKNDANDILIELGLPYYPHLFTQ